MKILSVAVAAATALSLLTTLICGCWIRAHSVTDPGSLRFHMQAGGLTCVLVTLSLALLLVLALSR